MTSDEWKVFTRLYFAAQSPEEGDELAGAIQAAKQFMQANASMTVEEYVRGEMNLPQGLLSPEVCTDTQLDAYVSRCDQLHAWKQWLPEQLPKEIQ